MIINNLINENEVPLMKKFLFIIVPLTLILLISSCQRSPPVLPGIEPVQCTDECSSDSCNSFNYISCLTTSDGCKDKSDEGIIKGKCGVECLSTFDCATTQLCSKSYKCETKQKDIPTPTEVKGVCGNEKIDSGENCGNCIDARCSSAIQASESCINNICKKYEAHNFEYFQDIRKYCGYTSSDYNPDNVALKSIKSIETCTLKINDIVTATAAQLFDGGIIEVSKQWSCGTKSSQPISMPQSAAFELEKDTVSNRMKIVQNSAGNDDGRNINKYTIETSVDSTDGKNGYWIKIHESNLRNKYQTVEEIRFEPTSIKWIRVNVLSLHNPTSNIFTLAELEVYEARYMCVGDINSGEN
ncbi:MAG TPA: hypothetical protein VJH20_02690 [Candidatus Nanoarchaeia archaeon]|nr:hypothetical protein [Candidatus Nanoarchaeia archaeon]